jgi:diguanylate cyclase (GGDEF)-like protein
MLRARRIVDLWWLAIAVFVVLVIALTVVLSIGESDRASVRQHGQRRQVVSGLAESVAEVLSHERELAAVVGTQRGSPAPDWGVVSGIVMNDSVANTTAFIEPVTQRDRRAFHRETGITLFESPRPGVTRPAARRPLHLVVTADRRRGSGPVPIGLDLAADPLRSRLLSRVARTGAQLATPPVEFLSRQTSTLGVVVFSAVTDSNGRLEGWVSAGYTAAQLAATATATVPGARLTIRDGSHALVGDGGTPSGRPTTIVVAGRRWSVWAQVPGAGVSAVPWLVLGLGLTLAAALAVILRLATAVARRSSDQLALRDAEHTALSRVATLVAQGKPPDVVFAAVAEQIGTLLHSETGAVSRFDDATGTGQVLAGWARDGQDQSKVVFGLDGVTASAAVFRTGSPARTESGYASDTDPIAAAMIALNRTEGVAAPIMVAGRLWGALGAAYSGPAPTGAELRLERFTSLVGLAVSNAEAWEQLALEASSDSLTGLANRRLFNERLTSEIHRAHRYGRLLSLVLIDLDHFKTINDVYGHPAGDRVLVGFAELLTRHRREGELVARIGGEEFAWLLPETDSAGARKAAERVRETIQGTSFAEVRKVTISAGVASTVNAHGAEALIREADRALYRAKANGRNMTAIYSDDLQADPPALRRVVRPHAPGA